MSDAKGGALDPHQDELGDAFFTGDAQAHREHLQLAMEDAREGVFQLLKQNLRPEFLNRIDELVVFHPLGREQIRAIARIQLRYLQTIREKHPRFRCIGHFDKMVMNRGEAAMRAEFERLLPVARQGGFLISCDHQTPPGVSYDQYQLYLSLFREYGAEAGHRLAEKRIVPGPRSKFWINGCCRHPAASRCSIGKPAPSIPGPSSKNSMRCHLNRELWRLKNLPSRRRWMAPTLALETLP